MSIAYTILVSSGQQILSLLFSDLSLTFQLLGACEIQFNSHRETDKASLGAMVYQSPITRQYFNNTTSSTMIHDDKDVASGGRYPNGTDSVTHF